MPASFDPYHLFLGIARDEQPPDHYRLLGIERFEFNLDVIQSAAERQLDHVKRHGTDDMIACSRLGTKIKEARDCLLSRDAHREYVAALRKTSSIAGNTRSHMRWLAFVDEFERDWEYAQIEDYDPEHHWLGIPRHAQPASAFRLLGLREGESDPEVIRSAAERQIAHVRKFTLGENGVDANNMLRELGVARIELLQSVGVDTSDEVATSTMHLDLESTAGEDTPTVTTLVSSQLPGFTVELKQWLAELILRKRTGQIVLTFVLGLFVIRALPFAMSMLRRSDRDSAPDFDKEILDYSSLAWRIQANGVDDTIERYRTRVVTQESQEVVRALERSRDTLRQDRFNLWSPLHARLLGTSVPSVFFGQRPNGMYWELMHPISSPDIQVKTSSGGYTVRFVDDQTVALGRSGSLMRLVDVASQQLVRARAGANTAPAERVISLFKSSSRPSYKQLQDASRAIALMRDLEVEFEELSEPYFGAIGPTEMIAVSQVSPVAPGATCVTRMDLHTGESEFSTPIADVDVVLFADDRKTIVVSERRLLTAIDSRDGGVLWSWLSPSSLSDSAAFSGDGKTAYLLTNENSVLVFDLDSRTLADSIFVQAEEIRLGYNDSVLAALKGGVMRVGPVDSFRRALRVSIDTPLCDFDVAELIPLVAARDISGAVHFFKLHGFSRKESRVAETPTRGPLKVETSSPDAPGFSGIATALPRRITNSIGIELAAIMPSQIVEGGDARDENPRDDMNVASPFYLGTTEVTQSQWQNVMGTTPWKEWGVKESPDYPANYVSWEDAISFCARLSESDGRVYGLPSETQWDLACRAKSRGNFSFGDSAYSLGHYAWYKPRVSKWRDRRSNNIKHTQQVSEDRGPHEVASKLPNAFGLYDMYGNVLEWCNERRSKKYLVKGSVSSSFDGDGWVGGSGYYVDRIDNHFGFRVFSPVDPREAAQTQQHVASVIEEIEVKNPDTPELDETADVINSIGMTLVFVNANSFSMGGSSTKEQLAKMFGGLVNDYANEFPKHMVSISKSFYLGKTEVTQKQWVTVMRTTPWNGKTNVKEGDTYPATYVSWDDASEFCRRLSVVEKKNYRLPTEAEWEYSSAPGIDERNVRDVFSWSLRSSGVWCRNTLGSSLHPCEVNSPNWRKPRFLHMHGNVCEWCFDWYGEDYYNRSPSQDPTGPASGISRVTRGGSFMHAAVNCRSTSRGSEDPAARRSHIGFRVVLDSLSVGSDVGSTQRRDDIGLTRPLDPTDSQAAIADRAAAMIASLASFTGSEKERMRRVTIAYSKISEACSAPTADNRVLSGLVSTIKQSPMRKEIANAGSDWLRYSRRPNEGFVVIGVADSGNEGQIINLPGGETVTVVGAKVPLGEQILVLGRIVDGDRKIRVLAVEKL